MAADLPFALLRGTVLCTLQGNYSSLSFEDFEVSYPTARHEPFERQAAPWLQSTAFRLQEDLIVSKFG